MFVHSQLVFILLFFCSNKFKDLIRKIKCVAYSLWFWVNNFDRHPDPNSRLSFKMIAMKLNTDQRKFLEVQAEDGLLGSHNKLAENRFDDLRNKYC